MPYWEPKDKAIPYWRSKAEAEKDVLEANSDDLKIVALRPCMLIGLQEHALIPAQPEALEQGKSSIHLGDNKNIFDCVSADSCADAHLLAMHALLDRRRQGARLTARHSTLPTAIHSLFGMCSASSGASPATRPK